MGTNIPLPPEPEKEDDCTVWRWNTLYNSALDIRVSLPTECFVGAITMSFGKYTKLYSIEVISEGKLIGKYSAETGKYFTGDVTVNIGTTSKEFTIRLLDAVSSVMLRELRISGAYEDGKPFVWPTPKSAEYGEGSVHLSKIAAGGTKDEKYAARFLHEAMQEKFGARCFKKLGIPLSVKLDRSLGERLIITVTEDNAVITAGCRLSLLRAASILVSISEGGKFPVCKIDDTPEKEMRGFHLGVPSRPNIDFTKRLFRYVLLPLGYNQLFIQLCGGMRYESHPKITEAWLLANRLFREGKAPRFPHDYMGAEGYVLEKDEVRDLFGYARELGFELIPEVQSLGHVQWITNAYPEIGEVDENEKQVEDTRAEDLRPDKKFIHCYCPSNERSYEIIFDIIDETIDVIKPQRYVHIGHDEVYHLGLCEKCRGKSHAELFANDVIRIYDHLKRRGLGTMMWGDMLQPTTKYETKPAINMLPRDIVQLDFIWYFHLDMDIENNLIEAGYPVVLGNLYSSHFPRYKKRASNKAILGGQVSSWCCMNEYSMAEKGKFWDLIYTSEFLSRPELCEDDMRLVYSKAIAEKIQPEMRDKIREKYSPRGWSETKIALNQAALSKNCEKVQSTNKSFASGNTAADQSVKVPKKLLDIRKNTALLDGARIHIGKKFERLAIEQTTLNIGIREPWEGLEQIGTYTVSYKDGTSAKIPLEYAGGIQHSNRHYAEPLHEPNYRHYGYTATWFTNPTVDIPDGSGGRILLMEYLLENPYPEKEIEEISFERSANDFTHPVICGIKGMNRK